MLQDAGLHPCSGAGTMIVSLDNLYHSEFSFLPARSAGGDLKYVDIITHFVSPDGVVHMPSGLVIPRMSDDEQRR